jgi:hypothetical protein
MAAQTTVGNYCSTMVHPGTLWLFNIAMESGPFTDDFPSYKPPFIVDFPVRYVK